MKSFKSYISEEVLPTARVENGNFDLENDAVRAEVNSILAGICSVSHVTPYVTLRKVSKALAYFSVILPKRTFLEGNRGVEVYEIKQFGDRIGMTDQGEFVTQVPVKYHLFFQYVQIMGRFMVTAKVVDQVELDRLLDTAEMTMKESCDDKATMSQRKAGREEIQPETPSTKKAVADSEKALDEAMTRKQKDMAVRRFMSHDPKAGESILKMGKKDREEKKSFASAKKEIKQVKEEQIDEVGDTKRGRKTLGDYIKRAHVSGLEAASKGEIAYARKDKAGLHKANKTGEKREQGINRAADRLSMEEEYEKVEAGVKKRPGETHTLHRRNPGHKTEYHTITTDRDGRKSVKTGSPKYIKKHWDKLEEEHLDELWEPITGSRKDVGSNRRKRKAVQMALGRKHKGEEGWNDRTNLQHSSLTMGRKLQKQGVVKEDNLDEVMGSVKKSYAMRKMKKKVSTQVKQGLGVGKEKSSTVLVTNKGDPAAAGGGGVHRIPRDKYDPSKHNLASE